MERRRITTDRGPAAIGPYSQAIEAGDFVFVSGQIPLDPATMTFVSGDAAAQTERVMKNLAAILDAAGTSIDRTVKATIYLKNLQDFEAVNRVYGAAFRGDPPARATVEVSGLPKGALVEIEVIALKGKSS
ncbi:MAG TPA: RidA family protein [Verrucomicrobiae bacterium]|nr:RidA family protein [Verrucomicrobiae bacterium]